MVALVRSLTSLIVALAVLAPGLTWPGHPGAGAGAGAHACCVRMQAQGCPATIACCPAPERGRETSTPPASTSAGVAPSQAHASSPLAVGPPAALAKAIAFDAIALARANAPPGPLYLKHLTLLV